MYRINLTIKNNKPISYKALSIITCIFSALYYVTDNVLWVLSVLIKSKVLAKGREKDVKHKKNLFSFYRVIFYIVTLIYDLKLKSDEIKIIKENILDEKNIGRPELMQAKLSPRSK